MNTRYFVTAANAALLIGASAALVVGGLNATGEPLSGLWGPGSPAVEAERSAHPFNAPDADSFKGTLPAGCVAHLPSSVIPSALAVVTLDGSVVTMPLDDVIARAESDDTADDVWVVGSCR